MRAGSNWDLLCSSLSATSPCGPGGKNSATLLSTPGVLSSVALFFPPGPQGEVALRLLHNRSQLLPARMGQWLNWDSGVVTIALNFPLGEKDYQCVLQAKAPNANYAHELMVKFDVAPNSAYNPLSAAVNDLDRINEMLRWD